MSEHTIPARLVMLIHQEKIKYIITGLLSALTHYVTLICLVELVDYSALFGNLISFAIAALVSFSGHHLWTFKGHGQAPMERLPAHFLIALLSLGLNQCLFWLALKYTPFPYYLSILFIMGIVAAISFVATKRITFKVADE